MSAVHITTANFEEEVIKSEKPVLLDFWAPWCGPCKMLLPIVEELAETVEDTKICKINCDEEIALAQKYKVATIPTLVVMKNGEEISRSVGLKSKAEILSMLNI
jgi:thioredoxin 1